MQLNSPNMVLPKVDKLTCRACLKSGGIGIMHSFTDAADCSDGEKELRDLYKKLTKIEVHTTEEKKPILICGSCTSKLITAYEFILEAQRAENLLSIHLTKKKTNYNQNEEPDEINIEIPQDEDSRYKVEFVEAEKVADIVENSEDFNDFESLNAVVNEVELDCETLDEEDKQLADQNDDDIDDGDVIEETAFSELELLEENEFDVEMLSGTLENIATKKTKAIGSRLEFGPKLQITCDECPRGFAKLESYHRHKITAHTFAPREEIFAKQPNEQNILCPFCPRTFVHKNDLVRHVNATHPEDAVRNPIEVEPKKKKRQYKKATCPHCHKDFPQASIKIHIRRHLGINPYKCDTCEKAFPRKQDLTVHIRQHTGERPHVCSVCAKSFIRPNKLSRHMRIHLGIRPYSCDDCGKCFSQGTTAKKAHQNKKYLEKLKASERYDEHKKKKADLMRQLRAKQKAVENTLPEKERKVMIEKRRKANRERVRRHRALARQKICDRNNIANVCDKQQIENFEENIWDDICVKEEEDCCDS